jgi:putative ABC transport system permease protein
MPKRTVPLFYLFVEAWETIRHNKMRTFLTMLGMNIGVGAIIAIISLGLMARESIMAEVGEMGATMIWIYPDWNIYEEWEKVIRLTPEDGENLTRMLPDDQVMPSYVSDETVSARGRGGQKRVIGVTGNYNDAWKLPLRSGRFISEEDNRFMRKAAVLGDRAAADFFGDGDPLGENILIAGRVFRVIGVIDEREQGLMSDGTDGEYVFIPYETYGGFFDFGYYGMPYLSRCRVNVGDVAHIGETTNLIKGYLIRRYGYLRGEPRFIVELAKQSLDQFNKVFSIITTVISLIAGISLLVSGIGIMNIMLVAITERTREIGIRKALGAKREDILLQFLTEAVIICLMGGGIGVFLGMGITFLVALAQSWNFLVPLFAVGAGLGISLAIGMFFGLYPAARAAKLPPVEALTRE